MPPAALFLLSCSLLLLVAVWSSQRLSRLEEDTRVIAEEIAMLRARRGLRQPPA